MADYCTAEELKTELGIEDTDDDTELSIAITAASRQIDAHCGRKFSQDTSVVAREFYAESPLEVDLLEQPTEGPQVEISTLTGLIVKTDEGDDGTFGTTLTINTDFLVTQILDANRIRCVPTHEQHNLEVLEETSAVEVCQSSLANQGISRTENWRYGCGGNRRGR